MKIFEVMWLIACIVAITMAITRASKGQAYGNYIYLTIFTGCVAAFMYWYKKRHRKYMEEYYKKKEEEMKEKDEKK
ncbi:MAG: hypothetical protein H7Y00_08175 [Fimbriimonadaceae bacterium]|nr:hypothetical protein [Chitinophagales bacterium]